MNDSSKKAVYFAGPETEMEVKKFKIYDFFMVAEMNLKYFD